MGYPVMDRHKFSGCIAQMGRMILFASAFYTGYAFFSESLRKSTDSGEGGWFWQQECTEGTQADSENDGDRDVTGTQSHRQRDSESERKGRMPS